MSAGVFVIKPLIGFHGYIKRIMTIRKAERKDVPLILAFIRGIAKYEKMENEVLATEELLDEWLFEKGIGEVIFAMDTGREVGFALYFHNFSTFVGKAGLYLEDLYVYPEHRGKGYGKALFLELVKTAVKRGCGRMEWVCLNWNQPSIDFYHSMGAVSMDDWNTYRLTEDKLHKLAAE